MSGVQATTLTHSTFTPPPPFFVPNELQKYFEINTKVCSFLLVCNMSTANLKSWTIDLHCIFIKGRFEGVNLLVIYSLLEPFRYVCIFY